MEASDEHFATYSMLRGFQRHFVNVYSLLLLLPPFPSGVSLITAVTALWDIVAEIEWEIARLPSGGVDCVQRS